VDDDEPLVGEVADEDAHDAEGQGQVGGQLGDRQDRGRAELEDAPSFGRGRGVVGALEMAMANARDSLARSGETSGFDDAPTSSTLDSSTH